MRARSSVVLNFETLDLFVEKNLGCLGARQRVFMGPAQVYLRIASRPLGGRPERTLDLADVEVEAKYQGQGVFKTILKHMEQLCSKHGLALYVESVGNPILHDALLRWDYRVRDGFSGCYWLSSSDLVAKNS